MPTLVKFAYRKNSASSQARSPVDLFRTYLSVVEANSKELLDHVFRLRYQVYCVERGFENAAAYPDGRERDGDDWRSAHFLVLYRPAQAAQGTPVGTVRLILPRAGTLLPVLKLLRPADRRSIDLPLATTAEVSRFAVPRAFRKRLNEDWTRHPGVPSQPDSAACPLLGLLNFWLIRAVVTMTIRQGITHITAVMEPALLRLLRQLGVEFHPIGGVVEHHGLRQPVWAAMAAVIDGIQKRRPDLWEIAFDNAWETSRPPAIAYG
jgi:N-acyl amino acid synthase of PEP-CTERM/exosortase system